MAENKPAARAALGAISSRNFEMADFPALLEKVKSESETAQVLIMASYLEKKVEELITFQLHDVGSKQKLDAVFGSHGPLSTYGSQLQMCYQLGWFTNIATLKLLRAFKSIRNEFAHRAYQTSYDDPKVAKEYRPIEDAAAKFLRSYLDFAQHHGVDLSGYLRFEQLSNGDRKICSTAILVVFACLDLLITPEANRHGVTQEEIMSLYPKGVWEIMDGLMRGVVELLRVKS